MARRSVLLIAAVVIAALGAVLVFAFASNAKEAAFAEAEPVKVLVATEDIPAGTSGADVDEYTEVTSLPDASVPDNALSSLTSVENSVTAVTVYKGQALLPEQFSSTGNNAPLAIPDGKVAVSVELDAPNRVADFPTPGSHVVIYASVKVSEFGGDEEGIVNNVLVPNAQVLAVAQTTVSSSGDEDKRKNSDEEITSAVVTLAVTNEEAKRLTLAYSVGDLHFGLLDSDSKVDPGAIVTGENFFPTN